MMKVPNIIKADGSKEPFDQTKLEYSLLRSKASPEVVAKVLKHLEREITEGMTTAYIYKHAFFLLKKMQKPAASRYSLRRAVMDLGPTGFPFEKYIAEILSEKGYTTLTDQIVKGGCVEHEVDVIAWDDSKLIMAEAKFHNELGVKSDLKVALYVKARFDDLLETTHFYGKRRIVDEAWLVTNTKFTTTAIEYGMCKGLRMIGWNYPAKGNLQDMIEDGNLEPLTSLYSLPKSHLKTLIDQGVILCKHIHENPRILSDVGIPKAKAVTILEEIESL